MRCHPLFGFATFALLVPASLSAQEGFFFKPPVVTLGIHAGQSIPNARAGIFDLFTSELTLERSDFATLSYGGELGIRVAEPVDLVLGVSWSRASEPSEFHDWVDTDNQPIEQVTTLKRVPVTVSARYFPLSRGRSVGRYAWVPAAFLPYLGAGAGITWYDLQQVGDFVDFQTLEIFYDRLQSSGVAATAQLFAGLQWWPASQFGLTGEARYSWGSATLKNGFSDFDSIDLKGFQWTAGVAARF